MDYSSNFGNRPQPADQGYVSISAGGGPVIVLNDRYSASNLMTSLPQPGHYLPLWTLLPLRTFSLGLAPHRSFV